jgi:hypothetical protein
MNNDLKRSANKAADKLRDAMPDNTWHEQDALRSFDVCHEADMSEDCDGVFAEALSESATSELYALMLTDPAEFGVRMAASVVNYMTTHRVKWLESHGYHGFGNSPAEKLSIIIDSIEQAGKAMRGE